MLAPLYPGIDELPLLKPPPYIHTNTAFFSSPTCGFVHTFKYKQSSLYTAPVLLKLARTANPTLVTFAASKSACVRFEAEPGLTGHEGPYPSTRLVFLHLRIGSKREGLTKTLPFKAWVPLNLTGAANLKSPIGAWPYCIPKYSETCEAFFAGCPPTGPLLVCTVWPTVQFVCRISRELEEAQAVLADATMKRMEIFILLFRRSRSLKTRGRLKSRGKGRGKE